MQLNNSQKKGIVVGITGGIGCGKTQVTEYIREMYHLPVIHADDVGKALMKPDQINYNRLVEKYGNEILLEDGTIDRKCVAKICFSSPEALERINELTHPAIINTIKEMIEQYRKEEVPMIFLESAILAESGLIPFCYEIWYIYAERNIRLDRLSSSRGETKEYFGEIIGRQMSDEEYMKMSSCIIDNSESFEHTKDQITKIMSKYL